MHLHITTAIVTVFIKILQILLDSQKSVTRPHVSVWELEQKLCNDDDMS